MSRKPELNFEDVRSNEDLVNLGVELERRYPELELGILTVMSRYIDTQRGPNDVDNALNGFKDLFMANVSQGDKIDHVVQPHDSALTSTTYRRLERQGILPTFRVDVLKSSAPDHGIIGKILTRKN